MLREQARYAMSTCQRLYQSKGILLAGAGSLFMLVCLYSIMVTKATAGMCFALHNNLGLEITEMSFTTAMSRATNNFYCESGPVPCHVYVTAGDDTQHMYLNFHIDNSQCGAKCTPQVQI